MTRDVPVIQSDLAKSVPPVIADGTKIQITREEVLAWEAT